MKKCIFFLLLFVLHQPGFSQNRVIDQIMVKIGYDAQLSMADFEHIPKRFQRSPENLLVNYITLDTLIRQGGIKYVFPVAKSRLILQRFDNKVDNDLDNEELFIDYAQLLFDLAEVYAKMLNNRIENHGGHYDLNQVARQLRSEFEEKYDRIKLETNYGRDAENFAYWRDLISEEL